MATIEENLQTLKDSTDAIKQAIIDKGGDVSGDITTWASAINDIASSDSNELIFYANIPDLGGDISGYLSEEPFEVMDSMITFTLDVIDMGTPTNAFIRFNRFDKNNIAFTLQTEDIQEIKGLMISKWFSSVDEPSRIAKVVKLN